MTALDIILIIMQLLIAKEIATSTIWRSDRDDIGSIKVMYCCILISVVLSLSLITFVCLDDSFCPDIRALFFSLMAFYSLVEYQAVSIINKTRVRRNAV
jgi:hypothetical protein